MHVGDRGVSSVVGYALLLVIVAFGIVGVVTLGGAAMTDIQQSARTEQAAVAMSEFDAEAAQVGIGDTGVRTVDMGNGDGTVSVVEDAGRVTISQVEDSGTTVLVDRTLGAVTYDTGNDRVAYQGGGVWRGNADGSRMISPPEYHYRGQTLTFPILRVTNDWSGSPGEGLRIRKVGDSRIYPTATRKNPLEDGHIEIEVTSEYHAGWAAYFRERTDGSVTHYPDDERVVVDLTVPFEVEFTNGVAATESGGSAIQSNGNAEFNGPQETGTDHPTADLRIEDRISACESGGCDDLSSALGSGPLTNGTYYADEDTSISSSSYDTSDGPVHVVVDGDLTFTGSGGPGDPDHVVTGGDQVRFYVNGDLEISGNAAVNTGGDPEDVLALVHSDASSVTAASGTPQFTGFIYAPGTDFAINGGGACGAEGGPPDDTGPPGKLTADPAFHSLSGAPAAALASHLAAPPTSCDGNVVGGVVVRTATASGNGKLQYEPPTFSFELGSGTEVTYLHVSEHRIRVDGGS